VAMILDTWLDSLCSTDVGFQLRFTDCCSPTICFNLLNKL